MSAKSRREASEGIPSGPPSMVRTSPLRTSPPAVLSPELREAVIQLTVAALLADLQQFPELVDIPPDSSETVGSPTGFDEGGQFRRRHGSRTSA